MYKKVIKFICILFCLISLVGCAKNKSDNTKNKGKEIDENPIIFDENPYEGIELVNLAASNSEIETLIINNSKYDQEKLKFSMRIIDSNDNLLIEVSDEVKEMVKAGDIITVKTKINADISTASAIEYNISE